MSVSDPIDWSIGIEQPMDKRHSVFALLYHSDILESANAWSRLHPEYDACPFVDVN